MCELTRPLKIPLSFELDTNRNSALACFLIDLGLLKKSNSSSHRDEMFIETRPIFIWRSLRSEMFGLNAPKGARFISSGVAVNIARLWRGLLCKAHQPLCISIPACVKLSHSRITSVSCQSSDGNHRKVISHGD